MTVLHCSSPRAHVNSVSVTLLHLFLSGQLDRSVQCLVFNVHRPLSTGILRSWFSHSAHQPPTTPHSGVKVFAEETTRTMDLLLLIISTILIWTYFRWKYSQLLWRVWTYLLIIPTSDLSTSVSPTSVCVVIFPKMLAFIVTGWRLFQQIVEHDMLSAFYSWHFQSQSNIMVDGPKKHTTIYKLKKSNTPLTISLA